MNPHEIIELAALTAAHGPVLMFGPGKLTSTDLEPYWSASKCRLDRWGRALKQGVSPTATSPDARRGEQDFLAGVIEEIFAGEVLTRVWTGVMAAHDRLRAAEEAELIARSVLLGHMEARHRAMKLLVEERSGLAPTQAIDLNRFRQRTESWTDLLLGHVTVQHDVSEFAISPERAREFSQELRRLPRRHRDSRMWPALLASIRTAFVAEAPTTSPNTDLNAQVASAVLGCFQPEMFDSQGLFRSLWLTRMENTTSDTQGLIDELFAVDEAAPAETSGFISRQDSLPPPRRRF